ncbi:MAG: hypothetical protein AAGK22_01820 [Acidobacteriota bacterium]
MMRSATLWALWLGLAACVASFGQEGQSAEAQAAAAQVETAVVGEETAEIDRELEELESEERELSDRRRRIEERRLELESQREESDEEEDPDSVRRRRAEQKFSVGSTLKVRRGEISRDALAMGGGVKIDGEVFGNAVAMGGGIKVEWRVTGDVIAVGENVELGEDSEVLGDVVSVGGEVEREEGAVVLGEIREVDFIDQIPNFGDFAWWDAAGRTSRGFGSFVRSVLVALFGSAFVLIASMLMRVVAPRQLDRVQSAAGREFWMAAFVGLMIQLLTLPMLLAITLLLIISIIGIPFLILIPFFFLAFCIVALVGYAGVAQGVGSWVAGRLGLNLRGGLFALLLGVVAIQSIGFFADFLSAAGMPFLITGLVALTGFLVKFVAWTVGLGAVVIGRFGSSTTLPPLPPSS